MKIQRYIILSILLFLMGIVSAQSAQSDQKSKLIRDYLNEIVAQEKIPGMIAAIVSSKEIIAIGSAGVRSVNSNTKLSDNDLVHIGSCTKAMTAALIASLVSDGIITWETTISAVFPELKIVIHPDFNDVTVWQLLTHRGGIPANAKNWWAYGSMNIKERRLAILKENLKNASIQQGEYSYSNLGYMVVATMAEKITGKPWESLIQERLFDPLDMKSAGFGPPGNKDEIDQPRGHIKSYGEWKPMYHDNSEALGPAGRVHISIEDWRKFIAIQLPGGNSLSLAREYLNRLITPTGNYAGGWIVVERPWGKGVVFTHSGSNTMWFATVWVAPNINRAFIAVTNSSDTNSFKISDKVIGRLIEINQQK